MRKRIETAILAITSILLLGFSAQTASAVDSPSSNIVISQVEVGNSADALNEIVEIYNNSLDAADITNWCIFYASKDYLATGSDWSKLACFVPKTLNTAMVLSGQSYARIISSTLESSFDRDYVAVF